MACVAVNSLVRTLELEFLQPRHRPIILAYQLISENKELTQSLIQKLESLIELFDESRIEVVKEIKELEIKLRDVAFAVEDEIELLIVRLCEEEEEEKYLGIADLFGEVAVEEDIDDIQEETWASLKLRRILQQAIEGIDDIKEELVKVKAEYECAKALQGRTTTPDAFPRYDDVNRTTDYSSENAFHSRDDKMVGKNDDLNTIMEMLTNYRDKQLKVITIEGMGSIGKTTLAKVVYEHPPIAKHFEIRAWTVALQLKSGCGMLREIPEIPTLNLIKLKKCYLSLVASAKKIQEDQHDLGNYDMLVIEKYTMIDQEAVDEDDDDDDGEDYDDDDDSE